MIHLNIDFYNELAQELATAIYDNFQTEGVIELKAKLGKGKSADIIFAFNCPDYTIDHGIDNINYIIIALEGTLRHSTDFDQNRLSTMLNL